jgi:DUF4097 and DUF4098 domain-containing protein YvlB
MTKVNLNKTIKNCTKLILLVFSLILCFSLAMAQEPSQKGLREKQVPQGSKVFIQTLSGDIKIIGWEQSNLEVSTDDEDRDVPLVSVKEEGNKFIVSPTNLYRGSLDLTVKVPKYVDMEISGFRTGDLSIENIVGTTTLEMASGEVHASKMGALNLTLSAGDIKIDQVGTTNIKLKQGDITLANANGSVNITNFNGDISVNKVQGELLCKSASGDIDLKDIAGRVNVTTSNGDVKLSNIGSDLQVCTLSGDITGNCIKGRVDVNNVNGSIILEAITGDVQATTVSGDINIASVIRPNVRYSLKTTSGDISLSTQNDPPGFTAELSSYQGDIQTDFDLKVDFHTKAAGKHHQDINTNITGRYGDGQAQLKLATFSGTIKLSKDPLKSFSKCE